MSFKIMTSFDNPLLPSLAIPQAEILADSSCRVWIVADDYYPASAVVSGKYSALADIKSGAAYLSQATDAQRPTVAENSLAGFEAASFAEGQVMTGADPVTWTQPFTAVACFRQSSAASQTGHLWGKFQGGATSARVNLSVSGVLAATRGSGTVTTPALAQDAWHLAIMAHDGANTKLRVDRTDYTPVANDNVAIVTANLFSVGAANPSLLQPFNGQISDLIFFDKDVLADPALLALVERRFADTYGL